MALAEKPKWIPLKTILRGSVSSGFASEFSGVPLFYNPRAKLPEQTVSKQFETHHLRNTLWTILALSCLGLGVKIKIDQGSFEINSKGIIYSSSGICPDGSPIRNRVVVASPSVADSKVAGLYAPNCNSLD